MPEVSVMCITYKDNRRRAERDNRLLASCHGEKVMRPWRAESTRMVQHQLIIPPPSLCLRTFCLFGGRERRKSLPQNLWHFLMTCQGSKSQYRCSKTQARGRKGFKPWAKFVCVRVHLSARLCVSVRLCVRACAVGCKLRAIEWKSGILKALGK